MALTLRDYQSDVLDRTSAALRVHRSVILQSPTGAGKSVIAAYMIHTSQARGLSSWLVCHRRELLDQLSETLSAADVAHGAIAAGKSMTKEPVQVASIQTLVRRLHLLPPPDVLVIDECHHATAETYLTVIKHCMERRGGHKGSWHVGLTATPARTDGRGLGDLYNAIVQGPSVSELIQRGFLSPFRIIAPPAPVDVGGVHVSRGDYVRGELATVVDQAEILGDAVQHYLDYVSPGTCLVYCVNRLHARHVTEAYRAAGVDARYVAADISMDERHAVMTSFRRCGTPPVIVSVDLFGEGLDCPGLKAVQLLRPTQSLILHLQQIGRGLRIEEGKAALIILDHVGNTWRHGLPDDEREWKLETTRSRGTAEDAGPALRHCPVCFAVFRASLGQCPQCGQSYQVEAELPTEDEGELQEIDAEKHRQKRAKRQIDQIEEWRAKELEDFVRIALDRGYKISWAGIRFAAKTDTDMEVKDAIREAYRIAKRVAEGITVVSVGDGS